MEQPTYSPLPGPNHTPHIDGTEYITEINSTYSSKTRCFHNSLHTKSLHATFQFERKSPLILFMALKLSKIWKFNPLTEEIHK